MCQYHLRPLQKVCLAQACHVTASNKDDKTNGPGNYIVYSEFHRGSKLFSAARSSITNSHAGLLFIHHPAMWLWNCIKVVKEFSKLSQICHKIAAKLSWGCFKFSGNNLAPLDINWTRYCQHLEALPQLIYGLNFYQMDTIWYRFGGPMLGDHQKKSPMMVSEPQKHCKNIRPDNLAKKCNVDDGDIGHFCCG